MIFQGFQIFTIKSRSIKKKGKDSKYKDNAYADYEGKKFTLLSSVSICHADVLMVETGLRCFDATPVAYEWLSDLI